MITITVQIGETFSNPTDGDSSSSEEASGISDALGRIEAFQLQSIGAALVAFGTSLPARPLTSACTQSSESTRCSITEETFERQRRYLLRRGMEVETVLSVAKGRSLSQMHSGAHLTR
jgi:hypothetical protein